MRRLFLAPCANDEARGHFEKTIQKGVQTAIYIRGIETNLQSDKVPVWGVADSGGQGTTWQRVSNNDYILFYWGEKKFKYGGVVSDKEENKKLSRELYETYTREGGNYESDEPWKFIIYLSDYFEVDIDSSELLEEYAGQKKYWVMKFRELTDLSLPTRYDNIEQYLNDKRI